MPQQATARIASAEEMVYTAQTEYINPDSTIITLTKLYKDKDRFSGLPSEGFLDRFTIFMDLTKRAGVPPDKLGIAFPVMLRDRALTFYRQTCQKETDILALLARFKARFENMDH
jgi:hypothetical protein